MDSGVEIISVPVWLTAAAFVALLTFICKIAIDVWIALRRRKHLVSALSAYLGHAWDEQKQWVNREEGFNLEIDRDRVGDGLDGYTPYILYDPTVGFSLQDIRREYGFLESGDMNQIVRYITAENYVNSILDSLRTEYVRGFSRERKLLVLDELDAAINDHTRYLEAANGAVKAIAGQSFFRQLRYALW